VGNIGAALQTIVGGNSSIYTTLCERARQDAFNEMCQHAIALGANVRRCIITEGGIIYGDVYHSVLFSGVTVGRGSKIHNSILMPNVKVGENTIIENAIVAENTIIGDNCRIGCRAKSEDECKAETKGNEITVIGENLVLTSGYSLDKGIMIDSDNYRS
jgi:glucose-1-phosphate adenylyltransferase